MEETKLLEGVGEEEEEGAEAHDGKDVGGVGEEGMAGDGEDGGDGVYGEDYVGGLHGEEGEEEHGDHARAVLCGEEDVVAEGDGVEAGDPAGPERGVVGSFVGGSGFLRQDEADGGDEEDDGEEIAHPLEALKETEAGGDEGAAHEDGSGDSPEEDAGLKGRGDAEDAEDKKEDEEVVDREGLFDGIAGEELGCEEAAEGAEDVDGEEKSRGDPHDRGGDGVAMLTEGAGRGRESVEAEAGEEEFGGEEQEEDEMETDPLRAGGEMLCRRRNGGDEHVGWMVSVPSRGRSLLGDRLDDAG